jgi:hypothetical protein
MRLYFHKLLDLYHQDDNIRSMPAARMATNRRKQMNAPVEKAVTEAFKVDTSKGACVGTVSRQWATRPDDQKFLNLTSLRDQVQSWRDKSYVNEIMPADIRVSCKANDPDYLAIQVGDAVTNNPTHIAFGQVCQLANVPAYYAREIPAPLAALNLNFGLNDARQVKKSAYLMDSDSPILRGITSTKYGRIFDEEVVNSVMKIAGNGTGETRWKVPGVIDWSNSTYNPFVDITKETTTLYASDRDVFMFLVDDTHPIEIGKLPSGEPDLYFRGFYVWNSEVGMRTFGIATMYLRGVCQNRNLWGVEGFSELTFKHTSGAPEKFITDASPSLLSFSDRATHKVVTGVIAAKQQKIAIGKITDEDRLNFLMKFGLTKKQADAAIKVSEAEENTKPDSIWDMAQAVTAMARVEQHQDKRLSLELIGGKMLDKVA